MKKCLKKLELKIYHVVKGEKIDGVHAGIRGDVTGIRGDVTGIRGDVTGIEGDVTGIRGDVTGIEGDVDGAGLTDDERRSGVDVSQLIEDREEKENGLPK